MSLSTSFDTLLLQKLKENPVFPNILPKAIAAITHTEVCMSVCDPVEPTYSRNCMTRDYVCVCV